MSPTTFTVIAVAASIVQLLLAIWVGRLIRLNRDLKDLIFASTPICLICYRPETGHAVLEEFGEIDPVHEFIRAYLVYVPVFEPRSNLISDLR